MTKYLASLFALTAILSGCALTEVAYYVDREYGVAQNDAFDQQIAHKNSPYAGNVPNSMQGIHSEKIMDAYQYSFDRKLDKTPTNSFSRGTTNFDTLKD